MGDNFLGYIKVPSSGDKGVVRRGFHSLKNIAIPGMNSEEAVDHALDQILGPRQPMPEDAPMQHLYVVELTFAGGTIPTLMIGKIEYEPDARASLLAAYSHAADRLNHPQPTSDFNYIKSLVSRHNKPSSTVISLANAHIDTMRDKFEGKPENAPALAIWVAGNTDMSVSSQMFGVCGPVDDGRYRLMAVPPAHVSHTDDHTVNEGVATTAHNVDLSLSASHGENRIL